MSIWNKNEKKHNKMVLDKDINVDILIIGAGITGLTTAYYLKNSSICVVDASSFGHGVTQGSTAKITYLQSAIYTKITNKQKAKLYLKSQLDAIKYLKNIIENENIKCHLKKVPSYIFASTKKDIKKLKEEVNFLKENKVDIKEKKLPLKITSYASFYVDDTYTFNPIEYLDGLYNILKDKVSIYEDTKILKIEENDLGFICYGDKHHIKCKKVVVACHYPFFTYPFMLPLKSYIEKSYIVVSKVRKNENYSCINVSNPTYSCRFYEDDDGIYQISLSESHNTAVKQNDEHHFKRVREIFNLDDENILMEYSNVDIITSDNLPYIGKIKENMFLATGYNTWGMTNGILASKIITDLILKNNNEYVKLFDPKRSTIKKLPYCLVSQIKSFFGPKIYKNKSWYHDKITFSEGIATYIDEKGKKHTVYNKCPHFGCSLIFNEVEETWDCPCHSSRFDIDGKCIKGPSKYDISYHETENNNLDI